MEDFPWSKNTKTGWERTSVRTGWRGKQRGELRTARKAKSLKRAQCSGGSLAGLEAKELGKKFAGYSRKPRKKQSELRNMAFFVQNW